MIGELHVAHQLSIRKHRHQDRFTQAGCLGKILQAEVVPDAVLGSIPSDDRFSLV
jgi:hypothetical protein